MLQNKKINDPHAAGVRALAHRNAFRSWENTQIWEGRLAYAAPGLSKISECANNAVGYFSHLYGITSNEVIESLNTEISDVTRDHLAEWVNEFNEWRDNL